MERKNKDKLETYKKMERRKPDKARGYQKKWRSENQEKITRDSKKMDS